MRILVGSCAPQAGVDLRTVRLTGHPGSDFEAAYRTPGEITAAFDRDPVLCTAKLLIDRGHLSPTEILALYEQIKRTEVLELAEQVSKLPRLTSAKAVMKPLLDGLDEAVAAQPRKAHPAHRSQIVGTPLPDDKGPLTFALAINRALLDVLTAYPEALIFGEDVARKGGVYGVTRGLIKKIGSARVFDTLLDEQAILGLALGAGISCCRSRRSNTSPTCTTPPTSPRGRRDPAILLRPAITQPHSGAHRRLRIPERFRRTLPQRQRHRRTARYPRHHHRLPGPPDDAAAAMMHTCAAAARTAGALGVCRTHCAVPHTGPAR